MKQTTTNNRWGWLKEAVPIFILLTLTAIFFSETLFGNKIFIHRDLSRFFYPLREFSVSEFRASHIPLWNPYIHCGSPHLAEFQTSVFYPLSAIYLLFSYPQGFNYFIILHIFLAGFFTYLLMREWIYSRYAAFLSAAVFMFSGYIISVINLLASLGSVVWLPLVILFYGRALKKNRLKNSILTGVFLALMILAGGEPVIVIGTILILILLNLRQSQVKSLALALLVAIGLTAFQILPFLEYLRHSSRAGMGFTEASMWSLPPYALLDLVIPFLSEADYLYKDYWSRQSWLLVYYMGIFTVVCAFISLKFGMTKRRKAFFYILALGLVISFGRYTPFYYFLYRALPGFGLSRYPIKFFFMVAFSVAVLAGMGLDYYRKNYLKLKRFLNALLVIACAGSFLYLFLNLNFTEVYNSLYKKILEAFPGFLVQRANLAQLVFIAAYNLKRAIGYFMFLALCMFLPLRSKAKVNFIIPVLLCVSLLDIFTANRDVYQNMDIEEYLEPGPTIGFLKKDTGLYRTFNSPTTIMRNVFIPERDYFEGVRSAKERMVTNRNVSFGIYSAYGYGSLYNKRHEKVVEAIVNVDSPEETNLLNLLNAKYVISPKDFKAKGYKMVRKGEKANIYENENVLPRAFLVDKAVIIKDEEKILERMKSRDFNPAGEVILEEDFSSTNHYPLTSIHEQVDILKYSPNEVTIETNVGASKFLVLSDSYYPGWKAYIDGERTSIYRANYILRAVYLEPGKHIVSFIYDPFSFKIGAIVSLLTVLLIAILLQRFRRLTH